MELCRSSNGHQTLLTASIHILGVLDAECRYFGEFAFLIGLFRVRSECSSKPMMQYRLAVGCTTETLIRTVRTTLPDSWKFAWYKKYFMFSSKQSNKPWHSEDPVMESSDERHRSSSASAFVWATVSALFVSGILRHFVLSFQWGKGNGAWTGGLGTLSLASSSPF